MKRSNKSQKTPHEDQKKRKTSSTSGQSARESPMSEPLDEATGGSSDTGQSSPPAGPKIVVHKADGAEDSFNAAKQERMPEPITISQVLEKPQEPPSPRQESPEPLRAAQRPREAAQGSVIQNLITCTLRVTLRGPPASRPSKQVEILLHAEESYQKIEQAAEQHAQDLCAGNSGSRELVFRYGNCTILGDNVNKYRRPLRSHEEWGAVYKSIVNYWTSHSHEQLRLHIWRDYHQQPMIDGDIADIKNNEIHDLMKNSLSLKRYIAHSDLKTVMSDHTIHGIIEGSNCEGIASHDKETFIQRVKSEGRILLAICVQSNMKMGCLKHLLDEGSSDATLPFGDQQICHPRCRGRFQGLLNAQGSYLAARFDNLGEHKSLHPSIVVPLHFCPKEDGKDDINLKGPDASVNEPRFAYSDSDAATKKETAECGYGAHSIVYCVKLDPNHHGLSKDLDTCFALKEFKDRGQKSSEVFDRELEILQELRRHDHPHIVTHLVTWTQVGRHFLLLPYAQCNLREYMTHARFERSKKEDVIWLLEQIHGMADAVRLIHHLSGPEPRAPNPGLAAPAAGERKTAWHHDLKPENILFFVDSSIDRGTFRISDWGSGKVSEYRRTGSYHTKRTIGTVTYEPPEAASEAGTSRPYDLWSLGCVYLELLIWAVFGPGAAGGFSEERNISQTGPLRDDAFWEEFENKGVLRLRSSVTTQMHRLDEALAKPRAPPFKELLGCVRDMLEIKAHKRIKASDLCNLLDQIYRTKKVELNAENDSDPGTLSSLIPTDHHSPDWTTHGHSPLSGRSYDPAFTDHFNLSPAGMSPRTTRSQHSRNSSASELMPSNATRSRQSSNASILSVRERRGSHSNVNSPGATEGGS